MSDLIVDEYLKMVQLRNELQIRVNELLKQNEDFREALKFYADEKNYFGGSESKSQEEFGVIAREVLAKHKLSV